MIDGNKYLEIIEDGIKAELNRIANEEIENLVQECRDMLNKRKCELISELFSTIEVCSSYNSANQNTTIQINIRSNNNDT